MDEPTDSLAAVSWLVEAQRPREAFALFLTQVEGRDWEGLSAPELRALDLVVQRVVPELLDHHTLWMVNHTHQLRQMLAQLSHFDGPKEYFSALAPAPGGIGA